MHFWHKVATEEASEHSTYDSLLTQKNGQKKFFGQKWSNLARQKFLSPQNRPFWGGVDDIFSAYTKGVPKPSHKVFHADRTNLGYRRPFKAENCRNQSKNAILQKFLHPQNRPFWGGVVEIFSARTKEVPKPSEKFSWALQGFQTRKSLILGQNPEISEANLAEISAWGCPARPQKFF